MKEYGVTLLRVVVGVIYAMHAYLALVVMTPAGAARFMAQVAKLPAPTVMAWIVILVHGIGGLLLILGFRTRWVAAANAAVIAVALVRVHLPRGFFVRADVLGYEYALLLLAATVALVLLGPGALAVSRS